MTLKLKYPSGMPRLRWEHEVMKHAMQKEEHRRKFWRRGLFVNRDDGKGWFLKIHLKVQMSKEEENAP
jgi:hypothetical protein